jgi:hypothetical protein
MPPIPSERPGARMSRTTWLKVGNLPYVAEIMDNLSRAFEAHCFLRIHHYPGWNADPQRQLLLGQPVPITDGSQMVIGCWSPPFRALSLVAIEVIQRGWQALAAEWLQNGNLGVNRR